MDPNNQNFDGGRNRSDSINRVQPLSVPRRAVPDQPQYVNYRPPQLQLQDPSRLPNIPPSAHLSSRPVRPAPPLVVTTASNSSPTSMNSAITSSDIHPHSPFTSGPKTEEAAGLLQSSQGSGTDLRPRRSVRSLFSKNQTPGSAGPGQGEPEKNDVALDTLSPGDNIEPANSIFSKKDIERHLPIVLEEDDSDEELPDIKEVVNKLQESEDDTSRESTPDGDDQKKRRGHSSKRRKSRTRKASQQTSKFVSSMRNFYVSILSKTLITRSFIYWLPLAIVLFIPLAVGAWVNPNATIGHSSLMWLFIWLEVVWGSLWVSRIVAHYLPSIAGIFFGIISPSWRKYTTILIALELPITLVFWAFVSFITFIPLLSLNHLALKGNLTQPWQRVVNNILVALLISSLLFLAERLFIHLLSVSFHKTRFAARIKTNKQAISTLSLLLQAAYQVFPQYCEEFEHEDMALESGALLQKGKNIKGFQSIAGNENMQKVVGTMHRVVGSAANAIGNVARDFRGSSSRQSTSAYKVVSSSLESKYLAEILAGRIWKSLVLEDSDALTIDDLLEVIGNQYEAEARALFDSLDKDGNGDLTLPEIVTSVRDICKERKTIFRSLRDMDSAIGKLHSVLLFLTGIIIIIVFIGMLAPSVSAVLATLGSTLLALSFVFSATAQEVLASCVFLFVKHPIDVGDIVTITLNGVNVTMSVVEISLLYTVLKDTSTGVIRQAPNAVLNTLWIDNTTRSGPMSTPFTFTLGLPETSAEDIENFKTRLNEFLELNDRDYMPNPYVQITNYEDLDRIALTVSVTHRNNFADGTLLGNRRTKLLKFFGTCVNEIPLHIPRRTDTYSNPELPMFSAAETLKDTETSQKFVGGLRTRQPFGFKPPAEVVIETIDDEKNENVFSDEPLSARDKAMQDVAMASGFNRTTSVVSRATTTGLDRSTSRGMRKRV